MQINILKPKVKSNCNLGDVIINNAYGQGPGCEHCGQLQPFQASICDGATWWCLDCVDGVFEEEGENFTKNNFNEIREESRKQEKEYIKKRFEKLYNKRLFTSEEIMLKLEHFTEHAPCSYIKHEFEKWFEKK